MPHLARSTVLLSAPPNGHFIMTPMRFDVYGTLMQVERDGLGWRLFRVGAEGKNSPVPASIPDFIAESELGQFLDDLFHEDATPSHPAVTRVR